MRPRKYFSPWALVLEPCWPCPATTNSTTTATGEQPHSTVRFYSLAEQTWAPRVWYQSNSHDGVSRCKLFIQGGGVCFASRPLGVTHQRYLACNASSTHNTDGALMPARVSVWCSCVTFLRHKSTTIGIGDVLSSLILILQLMIGRNIWWLRISKREIIMNPELIQIS